MNKFIKSLIFVGFIAGFLVFTPSVLAYYPTLSVNYQGGNDNVQINVSNAATYSQINLSYRQSSTLWTTINNIGQTDGSGYFTQVISMPSDGSSSQVQLYVTVGGQQSATISIYPSGGSFCGYYGCNVGGLNISPSSLNISVGQSASANVSIGSYIYSGSYYISNNSNSSVASASISGSTVNVYGLNSGSTTITVCSTSSTCAYLYVTVSGGSTGGNIYFSPSSVNLTAGQSQSVTIYNNNNYYNSNYYISSNSNSNVASAYISGNSLYVSGLVSGSTSINVCQSSYSNCATLYVTVSGGSGGSLSLSQTNVSMTVGQSLTVTAYNAPAVYISSNSNPSIVSSSLDVNKINLYGSTAGSSTIYVCAISSSSQCANIYVTVSGSGNYGNIYFSPSSVNLTAGQSQSVTIYNNNNYYNNNYYVSSNSNSSVASASISGSTLYVNALTSGSTSIAVCQSGYSNCATLYVTVSGGSSNTNLWFSPASPNLYVGQSLAVSVNSSAYATVYPYNTNAYYVASNSNSNVASASISGTVLNLYAYQNGSTNISVCHSSLSFCSTLYVTVGGGSSGGSLSMSQTSVNVGVNQNVNVTVYGSGSYYISSNSNSSVATASISGNTLSIYGRQYGSTSISICQSGYSSCVSVYVTVSGYSTGGGLTYPGVLGASTYSNGQLISENGTVYMVYKNTKTGFVSASVFTSLGFKFANVIEVGSSGLTDSGYLIRNSYSSHPWGTWVKSGSTVYFVHEQGLIPVPDWNTFLNNGGQASFIVSANSYDLALPRLSNMTYSDYRLR